MSHHRLIRFVVNGNRFTYMLSEQYWSIDGPVKKAILIIYVWFHLVPLFPSCLCCCFVGCIATMSTFLSFHFSFVVVVWLVCTATYECMESEDGLNKTYLLLFCLS